MVTDNHNDNETKSKKAAITTKQYIGLTVLAVVMVPLLMVYMPRPSLPPLETVNSQPERQTNAQRVAAVNATGESFTLTAAPWTLDNDNPERQKFGDLTLVYAADLTAAEPSFGGISGLSFMGRQADGSARYRAVTDTGYVFTLKDQGAAAKEAERWSVLNFRPVLDFKGGKKDRDTESVTLMPFGFDMITFERVHRVMLGDIRIQNPENLANLPLNGGLEGATRLPDGRIVLGAEDVFEGESMSSLWVSRAPLLEGQVALTYDRYFYAGLPNFSLTDLAALSDGSLLVLERYYNPLTGVSSAISMITATQIEVSKEGAALLPKVLARLPHQLNLDNFEGLSVEEKADHLLITVVSDNNFRRAQKTLLLQFRFNK